MIRDAFSSSALCAEDIKPRSVIATIVVIGATPVVTATSRRG